MKVNKLIGIASLVAQTTIAAPQTLLEMASAKVPFDPKSAVVVMIDYQQEYVGGKLPLHEIDSVVAESQKLLAWARKREIPVVHVLHVGGAGGIFDPASSGGKVIPQLAPIEGEAVIHKKFPNSFNGTDLEKVIQKTGRRSIVFAGLMTHMCLEATVRAAFDKGYAALVVASTTTTRDLPGQKGDVVKAQTLKSSSLAALADLVAIVDETFTDLEARFPRR